MTTAKFKDSNNNTSPCSFHITLKARKALDKYAKKEGTSRSDVLRKLVDNFIVELKK